LRPVAIQISVAFSEANGLAERCHAPEFRVPPGISPGNQLGSSGKRWHAECRVWAIAMPNLDPVITHRPEFADTQPDLRALSYRAPKQTALARVKRNAAPLLIGAGVGVGVALAVTALTHKKQPSFTLFPVSKSTLFGSLAKGALIALGRTALRRAFAHAVEKAATEPA
jgi:hypothetical protein